MATAEREREREGERERERASEGGRGRGGKTSSRGREGNGRDEACRGRVFLRGYGSVGYRVKFSAVCKGPSRELGLRRGLQPSL